MYGLANYLSFTTVDLVVSKRYFDGRSLIPIQMVPAAGFEPATFRVWTESSDQLSYAGIFLWMMGFEPTTFVTHFLSIACTQLLHLELCLTLHPFGHCRFSYSRHTHKFLVWDTRIELASQRWQRRILTIILIPHLVATLGFHQDRTALYIR